MNTHRQIETVIPLNHNDYRQFVSTELQSVSRKRQKDLMEAAGASPLDLVKPSNDRKTINPVKIVPDAPDRLQ
jgi:hypothetical protein